MTPALEAALGPFMERQRWYGHKGHAAAVRVAAVKEVRPGLLRVTAAVGHDRYHLLLGVGEPPPDHRAIVCGAPAGSRSDKKPRHARPFAAGAHRLPVGLLRPLPDIKPK